MGSAESFLFLLLKLAKKEFLYFLLVSVIYGCTVNHHKTPWLKITIFIYFYL